MAIGIGIAAALVAAVLVYVIWDMYQSRGKVLGRCSLSPKEFVRETVDYFVMDGWRVVHHGDDYLILERGPGALTALVLLVVLFPVGLVYLLTDWGRGKLGLAFREGRDRTTEFQITWTNASLRPKVERVMAVLQSGADG